MLITLKSGYYLGIDGGGTKTHAVITDESGFILGEGKSDGSNPHNVPINQAIAHIQESIQIAKEQVHKKRHKDIPEHIQFEGACLGLAGLDTDQDKEHVILALNDLKGRDRSFGAKKMIMVNDGLIGLRSATDQFWGVCLIAGTGANCYGVSTSGKEALAGDWGFILGDQGSAFAIGRAILQQVMKEYDGRKPRTRLTSAVLKFLNLKEVPDLVSWTYRGNTPVREIAQLTRIFEDSSLSDSVEISGIINQGVVELIEAYQAVTSKLGFKPDVELTVVLLGGLFGMKGRFSDKIIRAVLNHTPNANVIFPTKSPAEGAARIARSLHQKFNTYPNNAYIFVNPSIK